MPELKLFFYKMTYDLWLSTLKYDVHSKLLWQTSWTFSCARKHDLGCSETISPYTEIVTRGVAKTATEQINISSSTIFEALSKFGTPSTNGVVHNELPMVFPGFPTIISWVSGEILEKVMGDLKTHKTRPPKRHARSRRMAVKEVPRRNWASPRSLHPLPSLGDRGDR